MLEVALGRFNLHRFREEGTVNRQVESYRIHPDYTHSASGDSDLAILILRTPVEYSRYIRPICLWPNSSSTNLQNVENKMGYVVGWGQDELGNRYTEEPRMAKMPIVNTVRMRKFLVSHFPNEFCSIYNFNRKRDSLKIKYLILTYSHCYVGLRN